MVTGQCAILVFVDTSDDIARLVVQAARRVRGARARALAPYGLTPHQAAAFLTIARHTQHQSDAELRLSDLARRMRIAPRSATEVVDALCARDLVRREPSSTDRRATSLLLTPTGRDLLADVSTANPATEVFSALTNAEREHLTQLLAKVLDHEPLP